MKLPVILSWKGTFAPVLRKQGINAPNHAPISGVPGRNTVTWGTVTGGCQHCIPATPPKLFTRNPVVFRDRQNMSRHLQHTPKISRKFSGQWKFGLQCHSRDKSRIGYHPALVQLFRGIFYQETCYTLFQGDYGERFHGSWMLTRVYRSFGAFQTPGHLKHTSQPKNSFVQGFWAFQVRFHRRLLPSAWASDMGEQKTPRPLIFEIWHVSTTFLAKKCNFHTFEKEKWNFTAFGPP